MAAGAVCLVLASPAEERWLILATDFTSALLLGAAASAMILGHWYLVVLDLRPAHGFADYFLICSGQNSRQIQAIADAVQEAQAARRVIGFCRRGAEGAEV